MTGTVIDSFLVTLGIDGTNYNKGRDEAIKSNKKLRDDAGETAKSLESYGKQGSEFFGQITKKALEFFAVVAAGRGIEQLYTQAVTVSAATGRMANNIGTSTQKLSAWQNMMGTVGQSADDATNSLNSLAQQQAALQAGQPQGAIGLNLMHQFAGVNSFKNGQPLDPSQILLAVAPYLRGLSGPMAQMRGQQFGLTQGMVTALRSMSQQQLTAALATDSTTNPAAATAAQNLQQSFANLQIQVDKLANEVMLSTAPALVHLTDDISTILSWFGNSSSPPPGINTTDAWIPRPGGRGGLMPNPNYSPPMDTSEGAWVSTGRGNRFIPLTADEIKAQEQQESGGRQLDANGHPIVSSKGAVGIMQLLPSTAEMVAQKHGIAWDNHKFQYDAGYNQQLGILYMADLMQQFGSYNAALVAYNAGPNSSTMKAYLAGNTSGMAPETKKYLNVLGTINALKSASKSNSSPRGPQRVSVGDVHIHTSAATVKGLTRDAARKMRNDLVIQANTAFA